MEMSSKRIVVHLLPDHISWVMDAIAFRRRHYSCIAIYDAQTASDFHTMVFMNYPFTFGCVLRLRSRSTTKCNNIHSHSYWHRPRRHTHSHMTIRFLHNQRRCRISAQNKCKLQNMSRFCDAEEFKCLETES